MCKFLTIFLGFYLLHYLVCYNVKHHAIVVTLAQSALYQALPSLAAVSKSSSHACSTPRTHPERLKTARRKENSEAANLADFGLCCCNAQLAEREGLSWFSNFLRTLVRKSWSTVSNSPGALCRISCSVAGLIPGERTSASPRSVLQVSDRHLRRYPLHNSSFRRCRPNFLVLQKEYKILVHILSTYKKLEQSTNRIIQKKWGKDFTFGSDCTVA